MSALHSLLIEKRVIAFNLSHIKGSKVKLIRINRETKGAVYLKAEVASSAWYMSGVGVVVRLKGFAGAYDINNVIKR